MTEKLYTHRDGREPAPIPWRITLSSGHTRTEPDNPQSPFTDAEIADAGFIEAPPKPPEMTGFNIVWMNGEWQYQAVVVVSAGVNLGGTLA